MNGRAFSLSCLADCKNSGTCVPGHSKVNVYELHPGVTLLLFLCVASLFSGMNRSSESPIWTRALWSAKSREIAALLIVNFSRLQEEKLV